MDTTVNLRGHDIMISDIEFSAGYPAKLNALPEDCYPEDPPEVYFNIDMGSEAFNDFLEDLYWEELEELVFEECMSDE